MSVAKRDKAVKPEAMTVITLDEIAGRLADLYELEREVLGFMKKSEPQGLIHPVTLDATEDLETYEPPTPWFSVDVYNSGPNTVYVGINDKAKEFKAIERNRARTFDFGMAKIEKIYYKCNSGETATFDLTGTY